MKAMLLRWRHPLCEGHDTLVFFRFKVLHMSEAPILQPMTPLSSFITTLGEPPSQESLETYLKRMKEWGYEVSPTIQKALKCGAKMQKEVCP